MRTLPLLILACALSACTPRAADPNAIDVTGAWAGTANSEDDGVITTIAFDLDLVQREHGDFTGVMAVKGINAEPIEVSGNLGSGTVRAQNRNAFVEFRGKFTRTTYAGTFKLKYESVTGEGTAQMVRR